MKAKKQTKVMSEQDARELLADAAKRIQRIDESIKELQEEKKDIIKRVKDEGLNVRALKDAINRVRKVKKDPRLEDEIEIYEAYIEEYVKPV